MNEIGKKIEEVFRESGMKVQEFADKMYTSRSSVYNIYKWIDPHISQLKRVSQVLNHDFIADYFGYEEEEKNAYETDILDLKNSLKDEFGDNVFASCVSELVSRLKKQGAGQVSDLRQRIGAYLSGKKRQAYYHVEIMTDDFETPDCLMALTDEDLQRVRQYVLNADKNEYCSLGGVIDWSKYYDEETLGQIFDVTGIDFSPCYSYLFTAVSIESPESEPMVHPFNLEMTNREYSQLLLLQILNPDLTVQQLETLSPTLYQLITCNVSCPDLGGLAPVVPYVIFMTEAKKDANEILGDDNL